MEGTPRLTAKMKWFLSWPNFCREGLQLVSSTSEFFVSSVLGLAAASACGHFFFAPCNPYMF